MGSSLAVSPVFDPAFANFFKEERKRFTLDEISGRLERPEIDFTIFEIPFESKFPVSTSTSLFNEPRT